MTIFSILILVFPLCFIISLSDSPSNVTDQLALLDFKNHIKNADAVLDHSWAANTHFCHWVGVTCSPVRQRVTALSLPDMNLQGTISPSIGNLSFLAWFDLSNNSFHGSLPNRLGLLPRLRTLDLHSNQLQGNIPPDLLQSRRLGRLSLADNEFSGNLFGDSWNMPVLQILNLSSNNLTGSIPRSVGNLTKLVRLIFHRNSLSGKIPGEIGNMSSLMELDISKNQLTGSIQPSLFNMSYLRSLDLSNNSLTDSFLPNGDVTFLELEAIDLSWNMLSGELPSSLCRFTELKSLHLSRNNLTGQIPKDIGCLSRLVRLGMRDNKIVGPIPPSLGNISSLQYISCIRNQMDGHIPQEIGKLSNLQVLGFDFNNLTGKIPAEISNMTSLAYVALTSNRLSGYIPATFGLHLPNLQGIYLASNMLTGEILSYIANASRLKQVELQFNMFAGTVPDNLANLRELVLLNLSGNRLRNGPGNSQLRFISTLAECRMLKYLLVGDNPLGGTLPHSVQNLSSSIELLSIENSHIYGQIPHWIGNISSILTLLLNGNQFIGKIPPEISYLKELQRLYLHGNMLQGHIPTEFCNQVRLGVIDLSRNSFSGPLPSCWGNLQSLQVLRLEYNSLTSSLPSSLWKLRGLLSFDVSNNLIQGELPQDIGKLEAVESLDLSSNRLSSTIPSSLGELKYLSFLSLSNNSFQGSIPTSFGDLISLEFLNLSSNNLSGSIPLSLEKLLHLREIDVSYNNLEGSIPTVGVFSNSSPQSFKGNQNLCGAPWLQISLCPPGKGPKGSRSRNRILRIAIPVVASVTLTIILLSLWILKTGKKAKQEDPENSEIRAVQRISYHEIQRATGGFSEANLLGVGSSGSVYRATLRDGTIVAVKVLHLADEEALQKRFDAECDVLKQIRHRNLVRVITSCSNNDNLRVIVLQYMPNGSLDALLHKQDCSLDLITRIGIMLDVAMAIEYLHHRYDFPIVHCDIKPANVLLDASMVAHVSDFGISKILAENKSTAQTWTLGTLGYIAPEYGSEGMVSTAGDVYSYGIMLMELLTRRRPTDELFSDDLSLRQWVKAAYPESLGEVLDTNLFPDEGHELNKQQSASILSATELSLDCTEEAPDKRISMKDAVIRLIKMKQVLDSNMGH